MTPFGERLRRLRAERGMTQKDMARAIGVSPAYLSALEHGRRGVPSWDTLHRIIACLNIIWDEADELQRIALQSAPKVTIDTGGLDARATELANLLGQTIGGLTGEELEELLGLLRRQAGNREKPPSVEK